jgi:tripeptide aminopeptidase
MEDARMLEEFLELTRINANSRQEREMADTLIAKLTQIGCDVWEDDTGRKIGGNAGNLFAVLRGTAQGSILFSAHMDRVENGEGIHAVSDGIQLTSRGDTILGADDIAGVVAILSGLRALKASAIAFPRVEVLFSVGEEAGLLGSKHFDAGRLQSKFGYVLDCSGSFGKIINEAPNLSKISIRVEGRTAHAGNEPEEGIDASKAGALILSQLRTGRLDFESTANFPIFRTASTCENIVCDLAHIQGECRSHSEKKMQSYLMDLKELCQRVASLTGAKVDIQVEETFHSFAVDEHEPCVQMIQNVYSKMGLECAVRRGGGGMDANHLNKAGIVCVGVAVGYRDNHTQRETLNLEDFYRAGQLVRLLALEAREQL